MSDDRQARSNDIALLAVEAALLAEKAALESQNQALQEALQQAEQNIAMRQRHHSEEDLPEIKALQERAERAEHLLRAIAFDGQGKLQAWLQPLYIREPYVRALSSDHRLANTMSAIRQRDITDFVIERIDLILTGPE